MQIQLYCRDSGRQNLMSTSTFSVAILARFSALSFPVKPVCALIHLR
ncbi:unnamed protein product [Larinioides sclopetarius]|uniref:Uncharacterized protein n=1 Tax=Larinioides sclopetarius TaxID=280406 RepID=A0AAV1ZPJ1_9ARAC